MLVLGSRLCEIIITGVITVSTCDIMLRQFVYHQHLLITKLAAHPTLA